MSGAVMGYWSLAAAMLALCVGAAQADEAGLRDYLGGQGCLAGPETRAMAVAAGYDGAEFDALAAQAVGGLLPAALCTIRPPVIDSPIAIDDPVILATLTGPEPAYDGAPKGCFLVGIADALIAAKGYDIHQASQHYAEFLAAGIMSGELSFYGEDILVLPPGPQLIAEAGPCADSPDRVGIRNARLIMFNKFDELIRGHAAATPCTTGENELSLIYFMKQLHELGSPNAWGFFELEMILHAAGWADAGPLRRAVAPPLCHTDD